MNDSRRVYRAIHHSIKQLYPTEPHGNVARHMNTLAGLITGIVLGKNCQLPVIAAKVPENAKPASREKKFSRWVQNEAITSETYYLPFVLPLLAHLAKIRPLVFIMDGSEFGQGCLALVISVLYGQRALPIAWLVVRGKKGHFPETAHLQVLQQALALVPPGHRGCFLGDGEFDGIQLQQVLEAVGWEYACRTAKNSTMEAGDGWVHVDTLNVQRGRKKMRRQVRFTYVGYGPVQIIGWWDSACDEALYLVTNMTERDAACRAYQQRMCIETFFSDQKSRGFQLHRSHLHDPARLSRLLMAACLAYLWIIYLGTEAQRPLWQALIHRGKRCDLSLFQLGLRLLDYWLNEGVPLRVAFLPEPSRRQIVVVKNVR